LALCRKICSNGIIFGEDSIRFSFVHTKESRRNITFEIKKDEFKMILKKFKKDIQILKENSIPNDYSFEIFCKAIGFKLNLNEKNEKIKKGYQDRIKKVRDFFEANICKYIKQVGYNFYALYNVITEFGTFGLNDDLSSVLWTNARQTKAGIWLKSFAKMLRKRNIQYKEYLGEYFEMVEN
jgi:hypothetical protein